MAKTFSTLYAAIAALPFGGMQEELFDLWFSLEEEDPSKQLSKFDASIGDLSEEAVNFYYEWIKS